MSGLFYATLAATISYAVFNPPRYPPSASLIDIGQVMDGTTATLGIFDSSTIPDAIYGNETYNWCNMPHVRTREYATPPEKYTLKYVEVIQRHHKRTPYASNTFFKEDVAWDCEGSGPLFGAASAEGLGVATVQWQAYTSSDNPWTNSIGPGFVKTTCQLPQITTEGLRDSYTHGADLRSVYAERLQLPESLDNAPAAIRVTNNVITSQVAAGLVRGLFPATVNAKVVVQPTGLDSLEPNRLCRNLLKPGTGDNGEGDGGIWTGHFEAAAELYKNLDSVSGINSNDSAGWHTSFDHYYDNLSAKQCHGFSLPCSLNNTSLCVSQEEANTVYRLGNWEYAYIFRHSRKATTYSAMNFGGWMIELQGNLQRVVNGMSVVKYMHNVGHDGSIASLMGFLQMEKMVWPGMGSEIVFELYEYDTYYIRVLWSGQPMMTFTPLGLLDMIPVDKFFDYIDMMVGSGTELYNTCNI